MNDSPTRAGNHTTSAAAAAAEVGEECNIACDGGGKRGRDTRSERSDGVQREDHHLHTRRRTLI